MSEGHPGKPKVRPAARGLLRGVVSILITVLALYALVYLLGDTEQLFDVVQRLDPVMVLLAFLAFLLATLGRSQRFRYLAPRASADDGAFVYFKVTAIHQVLRALIPAHVGEFSYPVLLKRATGHGVAQGLGDLLIARFYDLAFIASALLVGLAAQAVSVADGGSATVAAAAVLLLAVGALVSMRWMARQARALLLRRARRKRSQLLRKLARFAAEFQAAVRRHGLSSLLPLAALTLGVTAGALARIYFQIAAFEIHLPMAQLLFLFGALNLMAIVPIRFFGGVGIKQAALVAILLSLGYEIEEAATMTAFFALTAVAFPLALLPFGLELFRKTRQEMGLAEVTERQLPSS